MLSSIANLFPSPVPPTTSAVPSPSEKGSASSASGVTGSFERALEKAGQKPVKHTRTETAEKPAPKEKSERPTKTSEKESDPTYTGQVLCAQPGASSAPIEAQAAPSGATGAIDAAASPAVSGPATNEALNSVQTGAAAPAATPVLASTVAAAATPALAPTTATTETGATPTSAATPPVDGAVTAEPTLQPTTGEAPAAGSETNPTAPTQDESPTTGTPIQITIRQAGTGAKEAITLEGNWQSEAEPAGEPAQASTSPQGVAHGLQTEASSGNSPVHINGPDRLAGARTAEIIHQISNQLEGLAKNPRPTLHIQLQPEELGKIDLRLTTNANGLRVTMVADQPMTREMLEANLGNLRSALAEAGINLSSLNVGQNNHPGQGHPGWQPPARSGNPFNQPVADETPADPQPAARQTSAIDYRV